MFAQDPLDLMSGVRVNFPLRGLFGNNHKEMLWEIRAGAETISSTQTVLLSVVPRVDHTWWKAPCAVGGDVFAPANLLPISFCLPHRLASLRIPAWESPCCFYFPEPHC